MSQDAAGTLPVKIMEAVSQYAQARENMTRMLTVALLAGGHVLVEGPPGTAKTLVARSFAQAIGGEFRRVQLTPDMLPGDVTGFEMFRQDSTASFVKGPLFAHVVLADELNRTTPRTQSAFLEAMAERQVTVEGTTHELPEPFLVIATQVPFGSDGTYTLTDVQADRFLLRVWSDYPDRSAEDRMLQEADSLENPRVEPVTTPEAILDLRKRQKLVHVSESIRGYILDIIDHLRQDEEVLGGPSARASLGLYRGGRALAFLEGRDFVLPDDIRSLATHVLEHRVQPTSEAELDDVRPGDIIDRILNSVPIPKGER